MRNYNTNFSFNDFLFILLTGFVALLLIAFLLINPISEAGKIDPKTEMMITAEWPDRSVIDIDLWIKGPENNIVSFQRKDGAFIVLERDDLGRISDTITTVDGKNVVVYRNLETVSINSLIPGEYVINVHNYTSTFKQKEVNANNEILPIPVTVKIFRIDPFEEIYKQTVTLNYQEEKTVLTFVVDAKGNITDKRTDLYVPLYKNVKGGP